jgi:hypothetical protein
VAGSLNTTADDRVWNRKKADDRNASDRRGADEMLKLTWAAARRCGRGRLDVEGESVRRKARPTTRAWRWKKPAIETAMTGRAAGR